jgi:hypothetical protein
MYIKRVRITSKKEMLEVLRFLEKNTSATWPGNKLPTDFEYKNNLRALIVTKEEKKNFIIRWDFETNEGLSIPKFKKEILSAAALKECKTFLITEA